MRKKIVTIYLLIFVLIILLLGYFFLYNIYGSEVRRIPENLFADTESNITIEVIPINALGTKAIFRTSSAKFEIIEGKNLVEVISLNEKNGQLKIRSLGEPGKVGIKIKSQHSLFPEYIEILINLDKKQIPICLISLITLYKVKRL
jgi:hypothetical protein